MKISFALECLINCAWLQAKVGYWLHCVSTFTWKEINCCQLKNRALANIFLRSYKWDLFDYFYESISLLRLELLPLLHFRSINKKYFDTANYSISFIPWLLCIMLCASLLIFVLSTSFILLYLHNCNQHVVQNTLWTF